MIRNQWYAVLESRELKSKSLGAFRLGERLVFWRDSSGEAHCFFDRCAHRGASLALGGIVKADHVGHGAECTGGDRLQCPFHGMEYDSSGQCVKIPANGKNAPVPSNMKMQSYPVHEEYGIIWIWWGANSPENLSPPPFFEDLKDMRYWKTVIDPWENHYTRVLENQLDVVHLPFVHYNTIGKGRRTLVEGPGTPGSDHVPGRSF
ncbi:MAG: aromatic ring-hydroxylating dioxygenase subunit alpha [Spirochaetales bacterium]|nr:aromatic ring-hydroxylating dioxygenase subunit alpha [Spirochaetales bacterium]